MTSKSIFLPAAACALFLNACSDSTEWEPGEPDSCKTGIFFRPLDNYKVMVEPDDSHIITVTLGRLDTKGEITVPVEAVNLPEGCSVASSATFADGSDIATMEIDITGVAAKTNNWVSLKIAPEMSAIYGEGSSTFDLNVVMTGDWQILADDVEITYTDASYKPILPVEKNNEIYYLEGGGRYKIPNFLNSGFPLPFELEKNGNDFRIVPTANSYAFWENDWNNPDAEDTFWYFYDSANDYWPTWQITPDSKEIQYIYFFDDPSQYTYAYIDIDGTLNTSYSELWFISSCDYTDETYDYINIHYTFHQKFFPAELDAAGKE